LHKSNAQHPTMQQAFVLLCLACVALAEIDVEMQIVTRGELNDASMKSAIAAQGLVQPLEIKVQIVQMNATILSCAPGYYSESSKCLKCQCPNYITSNVTTVWFEPL
jgi:hypothetical protein